MLGLSGDHLQSNKAKAKMMVVEMSARSTRIRLHQMLVEKWAWEFGGLMEGGMPSRTDQNKPPTADSRQQKQVLRTRLFSLLLGQSLGGDITTGFSGTKGTSVL